MYFRIFVDPTRNVNYKAKQNSGKTQRVKTYLKVNYISLTISSNLLYFNFIKSDVRKLYAQCFEFTSK